MEWKIFLFKLLILFILWLLTIVFSIAPLGLKRVSHETRTRILALASAGAGGIFLSAGFIHVMADAQGQFAELLNDTYWKEFPLTQLLAAVGFLFIFFLEKVST